MKLALNFKIFRFFLIPTILVSTPFFNKIHDAKAGLEFQWDQDAGYRKLKWFQKQNVRNLKNRIYFFFRPYDRNIDLLKINLARQYIRICILALCLAKKAPSEVAASSIPSAPK